MTAAGGPPPMGEEASVAWDPLGERAREEPGRQAILETDAEGRPRGRWTYGELDAAADALAAALEDTLSSEDALASEAADPLAGGHAEGSHDDARPVVALVAAPSAAAVAAVHGVLRAGAVLAPGHPGWTEAEREAFLSALRPAAVLVGEAIGGGGGLEAAEGQPLPAPEGAVPLRLRSIARPVSGLRLGPTRTLLWTSGTSGRPRAVRLSLDAHRASARGAAARLGLERDDRWMASLALAHVGGLALVLRAAHTGASLVTLPGRFGASALLRLAAAGEVTHASLVPVMLRRVLEAAEGRGPESGGAGGPPPNLRCLLVGGAATGPGLLARALERGFPVALTYGLTEAASQVATAPPELVRRHPGTVGPPLPGTEVRIAPDGEILVRGATLMEGYLASDGTGGRAADERTPDGRARDAGAGPALDGTGWLRTGDLGRLDDEGRLWVTGRRSRRIVSGGVTVDPAEVERALAEHPEVAEVAVVGLADEEWGERLAAAVVPCVRRRSGGAPAGTAGAYEDLRGSLEAFARERLSAPRRPRVWAIVDQLPRNPNGKPDREALRTLLGRRPDDPRDGPGDGTSGPAVRRRSARRGADDASRT